MQPYSGIRGCCGACSSLAASICFASFADPTSGVRALLRTISRRCIRCLGCCRASFIVFKSCAKRTLLQGSPAYGGRVETSLLHTIDFKLSKPPPAMSLVSGPGRAGLGSMPAEMQLFVDKHVRYIQSLDTVRAI